MLDILIVEKRGIIHSGIPSPDIKKLPMIPLDNAPYYRKKNPNVASGTSSKTESSKMNKLKSQPKLQ